MKRLSDYFWCKYQELKQTSYRKKLSKIDHNLWFYDVNHNGEEYISYRVPCEGVKLSDIMMHYTEIQSDYRMSGFLYDIEYDAMTMLTEYIYNHMMVPRLSSFVGW